jgi:putative ABC transport system permease protein
MQGCAGRILVHGKPLNTQMKDLKKADAGSGKTNTPPKVWLTFLGWFCPANLYEGIEGDLLESFFDDVNTRGTKEAKRRFAMAVIRFFRPGIILRNKFSVPQIRCGMLQNYLKVAWRSMAEHRTYSAINVIGLTLGLCVAILLFWIVRFEYSFDRYHANGDRLYQVSAIDKFGERDSYVPQGVIYTLRRQFQQVEKAATVYGWNPQVIQVADDNLKQENTFFVHPEFLEMIDIKWISGSAKESLDEPFEVILDAPTADKLFHGEDPLGRLIEYDNQFDLVVSGVIEKVPVNSEFQFQMIMSYQTLIRYMGNYADEDYWGGGDSGMHGYVLLRPGANPGDIEEKLASIAGTRGNEPDYIAFELTPLSNAHFDLDNDTFNYVIPFWMVVSLAGIGLLLIAIAIINFINLATAQASQRGREIGLRKVMGSSRRSIVFQFFTETAIVVFLSVLLAGFTATWLLPYAPEFLNTKVHQTQVWDLQMILFLVILGVATTFLAGAYPALVLSGLKPVRIFQNQFSIVSGKNISLRKSLVVAQFVIAQVLVICMVTGREQMQFFYNTDLGFDDDAVVTVDMPYRDSVLLRERFREQLLQHPEIESVTYGLTSPSSKHNHWWGDAQHPGLLNGSQPFRLQWIDRNYLAFYDIPLLAGRNFASTDSLLFGLINEKAVRAMGYDDPENALGERIKYWGNNEVIVIGVVKDYYSEGLKSEIMPHLYMNSSWNLGLAQIRIDPVQRSRAVRTVEKYWTEMHPESYFDYQFLSDDLTDFYEDERKFSNFILLFSVVGISIGCLGLFGLVSFVCLRRSKEISIRKVLGATLSSIVALLSRDFLLMVVIAFIIATPIGWYLMNQVLQQYTYHIEIRWSVFALAALVTLSLALLTVVFRSFGTANENPVERLRGE